MKAVYGNGAGRPFFKEQAKHSRQALKPCLASNAKTIRIYGNLLADVLKYNPL